MSRRCLIRLVSVCASFFFGGGVSHAATSFGPLYDHFPLTLERGDRTEALGPLYYYDRKETQKTFAIPPLFSRTTDPTVEMEEWDILYPAITYDRYGRDYRLQIMQLLSFAGGNSQSDQMSRRFTVFPFYFQQRSPIPENNYTALAPFYGTIKGRLFRDEIRFFFTPLYLQTRKKDVVTDNYLLPFFHLRHGDGLQGWQLWPLVGVEQRNILTVTNNFGDAGIVGGHNKLMLAWPIFSKQTTGIGTTNEEHWLAVLPLFARQLSPARDSMSVIWPFFTVIDDRAKQYREWQWPWPFVDVARGEGKTTTRLWPIFGLSHSQALESDFVLWPLYKFNGLYADPAMRERTRILWWLYSDRAEQAAPAAGKRQRTDLWPLFTARRDPDGNEQFQLFAPVEPVLSTSKSIERDWSPVWSVWRSEKNRRTGAQNQSFLWNLYRTQSTTDSKKVSLLFGLFQYDSNPEARRWHLFYVPVATKHKSGAPSR